MHRVQQYPTTAGAQQAKKETSPMRRLWILLLLCLLVGGAALAETSADRVSYFADPFGNTASFWRINFQGKPYKLLKIKSSDRAGEADYLFDQATLAEFEEKVAELRRAPNNLKADGFQVLWSRQSGDATVRTMLGRLNGAKAKLIQIEQNKAGQARSEHQICLDQCYSDYTRALQKLKKSPTT